MATLQSVLENRTWRGLMVTAKAHQMPFHTQQNKQEAKAYLGEQLPTRLQGAVKKLSSAQKEGLMSLKAHQGAMPLYRFQAHFGEIRPYRPWRDDAPAHPWRHPISAAERLWYLGLVDIQRGTNGVPASVYAPQEALDLLPSLPHPNYRKRVWVYKETPREHLLTDIAIFLGLLLRKRVKAVRGRWLSLGFMREWNRLCGIQDDLRGVRTELQAGRLKFLHYLGDVAGLVAVENGVLQPTVSAWEWLDAEPRVKWAMLWDAMGQDVGSRQPLWDDYRLPMVARDVWTLLIEQLAAVPEGVVMNRAAFIGSLRHYLPPSNYAEQVNSMLESVLTWCGVVHCTKKNMGILPRTIAQPTTGYIKEGYDALWLTLPTFPHARPLIELLSFATLDAKGIRIDADAMQQASVQGRDALQVALLLGAFTGEAIALDTLEQLQAWERGAGHITVRHKLVLSCPDANVLATIRQNPQLRPYFDETLSRHHLSVKDMSSSVLLRKLARRGYAVTPYIEETPSQKPQNAAAYSWVAGRVLQQLEAFGRLPLHFPSAVLSELSHNIPPPQRDALRQLADDIMAALRYACRDPVGFPSPVKQCNPEQIRGVIEAAYYDDLPIVLDYFSPLDGQIIRRTVTPLLPIADAEGAAYFDAWCERAAASRTFRLDRVVAVL